MGCRYCNIDRICEYIFNEDVDDAQVDEIARNCDERGRCLVEKDEVVDCEGYIRI